VAELFRRITVARGCWWGCLAAGLVGSVVLAWPSGAHPGSGIVVDEHGRIFFLAGPKIVLVETNGTARTIVDDKKNERFFQLHQIQRTPAGGWVTASDMGNALWQFNAEGRLTRFYPPPNEDRALKVGTGGDPFAVDAAGNIYAVNARQGRYTQILKVTANGRIQVLAGGDWGYADGRGSDAKFGELHSGSLLVMPDQSLILTDSVTMVRRIAVDGTVTTLAGSSREGYQDGRGSAARFQGAAGLAVDREGHILVVESAGRVRRIAPDGTVTTVAGRGGRGSKDGPAMEATFEEPTGITVAPNGDWYVLETGRPRVRKISGGQVTTVHTGLPKSTAAE
jgi:hypothetical protein